MTGEAVKKRLVCPCGMIIRGVDEDDLVVKAQQHLAEQHPGREYTREDILAISL